MVWIVPWENLQNTKGELARQNRPEHRLETSPDYNPDLESEKVYYELNSSPGLKQYTCDLNAETPSPIMQQRVTINTMIGSQFCECAMRISGVL